MPGAVPSVFQPGSASHFAALGAIVVLSALFVAVFRKRTGLRAHERARLALAAVCVLLAAAWTARNLLRDDLRWQEAMPLHLCDVTLVATALALISRRQFLFEFAYCFGIGGALQALVTPDLASDFPSLDYLAFFAAHGAIFVGVLFLIGTCAMRPGRGAALRMILAGNVYMAAVGAWNLLAGTNFGYLCGKPSGPSLLDHFGPWPWYLLWLEAFGILTILLLLLPFALLSRKK